MRESDVRTLGIVEIVVAVLLLIGMYYVHKSMPIDPPVRVYMIPADSDPCPDPPESNWQYSIHKTKRQKGGV